MDMNALLLVALLLSGAPKKSIDPDGICQCAEWACTNDGGCVCVKVRECPIERRPGTHGKQETEIKL